MNKIGQVIAVVVLVIAAYLLLIVVMPVLSDITTSTNTTMQASSNMSNYPGTAEAVVAAPWALFFVPAVIGMAAVILILKHR